MKIKELKTRIFRGREGWEGKTVRTEKDQTFSILTMKRHSGDLLTTATKVVVDLGENFLTTSFGMNDGFMTINHGKIKCTEKAVTDAHYLGLAKFDEKISQPDALPVKNEPEIGDIIFLDGYGKTKGSRENHHIIFGIDSTPWGMKYKCIEKDTLHFTTQDRIRPYSEKFGIGMYFEKGFNIERFGIDENTLTNMLIDAQEVAWIEAETAAAAKTEAAAAAKIKAEYLSQFKTADRRKTTSIIKTHCLKNFKISKILISTDVFAGGENMDVTYSAPAKIEELESFINKFQAGHFNGMEDIYEHHSDRPEIILGGHILQDYKFVSIHFHGEIAEELAAEDREDSEAESLEERIAAATSFSDLKQINNDITFSRLPLEVKKDLERKSTKRNSELFQTTLK